ncbi:hypothetical protein WA158_005410 [Blastocystis sp. Blastoise]
MATANDIKLFGKCFEGIEITDMAVKDHIAAHPKNATYLPHTAGRYQLKRFRKGQKLNAMKIVESAFDIINLMTDRNPIEVVIDAVINAGPREDSTRIGSGGVVRRQAVDVSPFRRVSYALSLLTQGASSFRNLKSMSECLADELINASKGSSNSYAIKKKDEIERVAKANR